MTRNENLETASGQAVSDSGASQRPQAPGGCHLRTGSISNELNELLRSYLLRARALANELGQLASNPITLPTSRMRRHELRELLDNIPIDLARDAIQVLGQHRDFALYVEDISRAANDANLESIAYVINRAAEGIKANAATAKEGSRSDISACRSESSAEAYDSLLNTTKEGKHEIPAVPSNEGIDQKNLTKIIRQQVKAEIKTELTDDVFYRAYRQEGSCRKAAEFLSEQLGTKISKDRVARAVRRFGGVVAVRNTNDSESVKRSVASQRCDRQQKKASPTKPPDS